MVINHLKISTTSWAALELNGTSCLVILGMVTILPMVDDYPGDGAWSSLLGYWITIFGIKDDRPGDGG